MAKRDGYWTNTKRGIKAVEKLKSLAVPSSFSDVAEPMRPCSECPDGQVVVTGWTGWEEMFGCTHCSWIG